MRKKYYIIKFEVGYIMKIYASCEEEACILAQAEMIKRGIRYKIESVNEINYREELDINEVIVYESSWMSEEEYHCTLLPRKYTRSVLDIKPFYAIGSSYTDTRKQIKEYIFNMYDENNILITVEM